MILFVDNYDSFTFNIVHALIEAGAIVDVKRRHEIRWQDFPYDKWKGIVIGPGPGNPEEMPLLMRFIRHSYKRIPIFGICLGHQCLAASLGAEIVCAKQPMHGKVSSIKHSKKGIFSKMPLPFLAMRYHSLVVDSATLPLNLEVTATTKEGEIMGLRMPSHRVESVQFHPESICSENGSDLFNYVVKQLFS